MSVEHRVSISTFIVRTFLNSCNIWHASKWLHSAYVNTPLQFVHLCTCYNLVCVCSHFSVCQMFLCLSIYTYSCKFSKFYMHFNPFKTVDSDLKSKTKKKVYNCVCCAGALRCFLWVKKNIYIQHFKQGRCHAAIFNKTNKICGDFVRSLFGFSAAGLHLSFIFWIETDR